MSIAVVSLFGSVCAAISRREESEAYLDALWESIAAALDYVAGVPYAWGVASALRGAPALIGSSTANLSSSAAATAKWAARAAADAYFVPVDDCVGLSLDAPSLLYCARGWLNMLFIYFDHFEVGMAISEASAAAMEVAGLDGGGGGTGWNLLLRLLKIVVALCFKETLGYFVAVHLEVGWDWLVRPVRAWQ